LHLLFHPIKKRCVTATKNNRWCHLADFEA
jgi:hypothetical protein